jgi:hypothetical protein
VVLKDHRTIGAWLVDEAAFEQHAALCCRHKAGNDVEQS